ncbi:MAG: GMC family oxidoreductase N-terminal domain-containing protein [bacterium]
MNRIALPLDDLKPHYDVVVIGSGYGGAISASRLARAGRSVCLLERGRERLPGEFPDALHELVGETQLQLPLGDDDTLHVGSRTALLDVTVDRDINVLVGCGLGGTSLINANVSMRPDPRVFSCAEWPAEVAADAALPRHLLHPRRADAQADRLPRLRRAPGQDGRPGDLGREGGGRFWRLPINVTFEDGVNHVGVPQKACTLCGDCVSGCNVSAKNTVQMNYLPDAANHGAEIFCEASVHHVERRGDQWVVHFEPVGAGRARFDASLLYVTADVVILAAGTLGTVGILLRSREAGLAVSDRLGARFTGNGDMLGFAYDAGHDIYGVGWGDRRKGEPVGPCITSVIDQRATPELTEGYIIEEGSIPGSLRSFLGPAFRAAAGSRARRGSRGEAQPVGTFLRRRRRGGHPSDPDLPGHGP